MIVLLPTFTLGSMHLLPAEKLISNTAFPRLSSFVQSGFIQFKEDYTVSSHITYFCVKFSVLVLFSDNALRGKT